ncbi:MAG: hypothetical protein VB118_00180 [Oscillospiraceae bacterium]|nr:hypothetical protein [Oscillospiraceae bacterium]
MPGTGRKVPYDLHFGYFALAYIYPRGPDQASKIIPGAFPYEAAILKILYLRTLGIAAKWTKLIVGDFCEYAKDEALHAVKLPKLLQSYEK